MELLISRICRFALVAVCGLSCFLAVGEGANARGKSSRAAAEGKSVYAKGRGVGADYATALKYALDDAIKRAIGVFVETEKIAKNNKIVKKQILTHSNAYVLHYDVLDNQTDERGIVKLLILAEVQDRPPVQKLRDSSPAVTLPSSESCRDLYTQIATIDKRDTDAEMLLKNEFDGLDPLKQLMKVTVLKAEESRDAANARWDDGVRTLSYQLKFEIDQDKYYKIWMPRMDSILSQISTDKGRPFSFKRMNELSGLWKNGVDKKFSRENRTDYFAYDNMHFMDATLFGEERFVYGQASRPYSCEWHDEGDPIKSLVAGESRRLRTDLRELWASGRRCFIRRWGTGQTKARQTFYVALVKKSSEQGCSGTVYKLSDRSASVIAEWLSEYSGMNRERVCRRDDDSNACEFVLSLKNATGGAIAAGACCAFNQDMSNIGSLHWGGDKPGDAKPHVFYITPWIGCFAGECSTWVDVEVNNDDFLKIAAMSISVDGQSISENSAQ